MDYHSLPVYVHRDRILAALASNQVIVVESPTGSGKTTQLPVILHEAGYADYGIIGVTQPRRIAAISVSEFVSRQLGTPMPGLVGYKMRFEDKTDQSTRIKIMTDGILLQEMKLDPAMSKYSVIMVDEAHERSLNIDFILGLLKRVLDARPEFKVIVSSATINAEVFSAYFGDCPIVKIETQVFPVTVVWEPPVVEGDPDSLTDKIGQIVDRVTGDRREGDILVFLPGEKAIKDCMERLSAGASRNRLHIIPLYARLGRDEQERVFEKPPVGKTKVIVSTNIAETSVTIDGITSVIDSGQAKLNFYNPKTYTASLVQVPISKASANQRKGRAGRTAPGICYRLYTRDDFENRSLFTMEEIYRTDLSEVVLRMAELGITDFERFDFISRPPRAGITGAMEVLNLLEAFEPDRTLSRIGTLMCAFPLLPRLSRMIVEAMLKYPDVVEEVIIAAAFLSTQSPYVLPPGEELEARRAHHAFRDPSGDFVSYLKMYKAFVDSRHKAKFCEHSYLDERTLLEIVRIKEQIELIVHDLGMTISSGGAVEDYLCAVSRGLIQFVCARQDRGTFSTMMAERVQIHPGSVMYKENPEFIVAGEIVRTTRMYAMSVSPLQKRMLARISPLVADALLGGRGGAGRADLDRTGEGSKWQSTRQPARSAEDRRGARLRGTSSQGEGEHASRAAARTDRDGTQSGTGQHGSEARDFTNRIKIGGEVFDLVTVKKRKKVILEWNRFVRAREMLPADAGLAFKGMTGVVTLDHRRILDGEKLDTILRIAHWLDVESDLKRVWPVKKRFNAVTDAQELVDALGHVLQASVWKTKNPELGFVALFTDTRGNYWFRVSRGFHTALNESLASLEALIDELSDSATDVQKERVGVVYRRLSSFFA